MGMHPNMFVAAVIYPNEGADLYELNKIRELGDIYLGGTAYGLCSNEGNEESIPVHDGACFTIVDYLTYGWGDHISHDDMEVRSALFAGLVMHWCKYNKCRYELYYGANFW